jgi:hypothetical protein
MTDKSKMEYGTAEKTIAELKDYNHVFLGHQHSFQELSGNIFHLGSCRYINYNEAKDEGKYIFFFCDDDILLPNCLEEHYKFAESHGECDTHSGQMWLNYKDGVWTWKELHQYLCEFNMGNSPSCKLTGGAVMFRKDHIVSLGQPYFRQLNPQHYFLYQGG